MKEKRYYNWYYSLGRTHKELSPILKFFDGMNCSIIVCTSRGFDRTNKLGIKRGTNTAIEEMKSSKREYVIKNISLKYEKHCLCF